MTLPPKSDAKNFLHPGAQALLYGVLVLAFLVFADQLSMQFGLTGSERVVDDVCGGVIAGVLVYWNERRRARFLTEKLKTIELMNHHVRNALQVIIYSAYRQTGSEHIAEIQKAVNRIDWALREILSGRATDENPAALKPGDGPASDSAA